MSKLKRYVGAVVAASVLACAGAGVGVVGLMPAGASVTITGTGSSYAAVAINNWTGQASNLDGLSINYQTQSSVLGLDGFANNQVDFGASEIGFSAGQSSPVSPPSGEQYQYLPDVAGAICMMYNVTSSTHQPVTNLQLDSNTLEGIFTGWIQYWDDPAIAALNPGVGLPHQRIIPIVRSDASGDNYIFSQYLATLQSQPFSGFEQVVSFHPLDPSTAATATWPLPATGSTFSEGGHSIDLGTFQQIPGSDNASNYVASNGGTITYVETAYAILHGSPCASIENASGNFVAPSAEADAIALKYDTLQPDLEQNLTGVFSAPDAAAYPISAYSYLITQTAGLSPAKGKELGQFIQFFACEGQISAGQLGYSPLPPNLVADDFAAIGRLPGADPPPPLDAAHCKNPYLTGALQYVGGPTVLGGGGSGGAATNAATTGPAVKVVDSSKLSEQLLRKKTGGIMAAPGQAIGTALNKSATGLLAEVNMPVSGSLLVLLLLVAVGVPPAVALVRRRRTAAMVSEAEDLEESL